MVTDSRIPAIGQRPWLAGGNCFPSTKDSATCDTLKDDLIVSLECLPAHGARRGRPGLRTDNVCDD